VTQKDIRIGIVDANGTASWAKVSHIPAIQSLRGVKLGREHLKARQNRNFTPRLDAKGRSPE